ncbi:MAG: hypothetical protein MHPSP_004378, partial [Paramarteilia canceri]
MSFCKKIRFNSLSKKIVLLQVKYASQAIFCTELFSQIYNSRDAKFLNCGEKRVFKDSQNKLMTGGLVRHLEQHGIIVNNFKNF